MLTSNDLKDLHGAVEALIDQHGLNRILADMSLVCLEKSKHIQSNCQDANLAMLWKRYSMVLDRADERLTKMAVYTKR